MIIILVNILYVLLPQPVSKHWVLHRHRIGHYINKIFILHSLAKILNVGGSTKLILCQHITRGKVLFTIRHRQQKADLLGSQCIDDIGKKQTELPHQCLKSIVHDRGIAHLLGSKPSQLRQLLYIIWMTFHLSSYTTGIFFRKRQTMNFTQSSSLILSKNIMSPNL